jgi:two-component system chemotaxis response regulator CheB
MDGITFLEKLMKGHPMPVVMVSSMTAAHCDTTIRALEIGAVDFFQKPNVATAEALNAEASTIVEKVKAAAQARLRRLPEQRTAPTLPSRLSSGSLPTHGMIAIGASTGGTEAICEVLMALPADSPGIVIVQHMPPNFTASFAQRLDKCCQVHVKEAEDGDKIVRGTALLAPGGYQMGVVRRTSGYAVKVTDAPEVNRHRPSVDYLFASIADVGAQHVTAAILTGMGADGARGMRRLRDGGARTVAQDQATCVVFGMPKEAIAHGGAEFVLPIHQIGNALIELSSSTAHVV